MRVLISGYYGFGNVGDEAVLESIVMGLRSKFPNIEITVLSASPWLTAELNQVNAIHRFKVLKVLQKMWQNDVFISGGGTLFQDVTSRSSFYYYIFLVLLAIIFRKRVIVFAQGFGPLRSRINQFLAKLILSKVNLIMVRDEDSHRAFQEMGIKPQLLHLTADPSVILEVSMTEGQKVLTLEGISREKPLLGISVRSIPRRPDLERRTFEVLAKVIDYLGENYNYQPVFLPFECPEDMREAKQVIDLMKGKAKIVFRICRPKEMLSIISQVDLLIGMRLHSLVFSVISVVPSLGISYDPKVRAFMKGANLPFLEVGENFDFETVKSEIEKIISQKEKIKKEINLVKEKLIQEAWKNFDLLEKELNYAEFKR